jgi:hypothetical protein
MSNSTVAAAVVRYLPDGALDNTWGSTGKVSTLLPTSTKFTASAVSLQENGNVVIGGTVTDLNGTHLAAVRYLGGPQAPVAISTSASILAYRSASLGGTVNARGITTMAHFDYGLTSNYGLSVGATLGAPNSTLPQMLTSPITALEPNTTYHFRVVATNPAGTSYGFDHVFTTPRSPAELSITRANGQVLIDNVGSLSLGMLAIGQQLSETLTIKNLSARTLTNLYFTSDNSAGNELTVGALGATTLAPNASTILPVSFTPHYGGGVGLRIHFVTTNLDDNPFDLDIEGYSPGAIDTVWRPQWFGTTENTGDAADLADPNHNGITNLMEYALGGNPIAATSIGSILPTASVDPSLGRLRFNCLRLVSNTDIRLTIQASFGLGGTWQNIARSIGGQPFVALQPDITLSESGFGNVRNVSLIDSVPTNSPAYSRRFLRLEVSR